MFYKKLYDFISSMKTGLVLLGLIGLASALGSGILPVSFFHFLPFRILLLLMFTNMSLCIINQTSRILKRKYSRQNKNHPWFRQVSLLVLHFGVVLILIGGTINTFCGQSKEVRMIQGETIEVADIIPIKEPFSLKLDEFKIEFNEDGSPSQYYSMVTIMTNLNGPKDYSISVNHPLKHKGVKAYQHGFGYLINVNREDARQKTEQSCREGEWLEFAHADRKVKIYKYIPNFDPKSGMNSKTLRPDNPRIIYSVYENEKVLRVGAASFGEKVKIDDTVFLSFDKVQPYTVLQLKSDPGLPYAGLGGLMLMIGVCLVLFRGRTKPNAQAA